MPRIAVKASEVKAGDTYLDFGTTPYIVDSVDNSPEEHYLRFTLRGFSEGGGDYIEYLATDTVYLRKPPACAPCYDSDCDCVFETFDDVPDVQGEFIPDDFDDYVEYPD